MNAFSRSNVTLAYIAAVLLLGGASAAGMLANSLLQLAGAGLIGWTLWQDRGEERLRTGLGRFAIAMAVLAAVQFLPLPPALWKHLPGRDSVYAGFAMLDVPAPWLTLSLAPWKSLASLCWWIPALAIFVAMRSQGAPAARQTVMTVGAVAALSVVAGAMQRGAGRGYFYLVTNYGEGPGFFANSNHQGSFLLAALALLGGYMAGEHHANPRKKWLSSANAMMPALGLLLVFGVLVSGSLACVALLFPVCAALVMIAKPDWRLPLPAVLGAVALVAALLAAFLLIGPFTNDLVAKGDTPGISRFEFLVTGSGMLRDFAPFGSGIGTFRDLYGWYEDAAIVGPTYVNHAHDDLLEVLIETGIFGLAALALFLAWFFPRAWRLWQGQRYGTLALAASVVIAVELLHSLVDYPLRTAAMSSVMAIAMVLLVRAPESRRASRDRSDRATGESDMIWI